jgi:hypothetical protein
MRRYPSPQQRLSELDAEEAGRGVTRNLGIEAVGKPSDHGGIVVEQVGRNRKIVVVDDRADGLAEPAELGLDRPFDRGDVGMAA